MTTSYFTRLVLTGLAILGLIVGTVWPSSTAMAQWSQCNGRIFAVGVDYGKAFKITDGFLFFNKTDEVYIRTIAVGHNAQGVATELAPYKSPIIKFKKGRTYDPLYKAASNYHCLPNGSAIHFTVVIREDDDFDWQDLLHAFTGAAAAIVAHLTGFAPLNALAISEAKIAARDLVDQMKNGPDDTIGAFHVIVANADGNLVYNWSPLQGTSMYRYGTNDVTQVEITDASGATFDMRNDGHYKLNVSIWVP